MGFNFPDSPTIGQLHPTPAVVGIPQYQWNGSEWVTPEYNPLNYVLKSGDTMLGALNVVTPPTQAAHAASKSYVDTYAAPLDALSYSGMQVNGSMDVSQEFGIGNGRTTDGYICDGWQIFKSGTSAYAANASTSGGALPVTNNLVVAITTAQASLGANDLLLVYQPIEGYRTARLGWGTANAKPITIAFWSMHKRTGTYSVAVRNGPTSTRSYVASYTQNAADTPEYKVITIPGDTTGTWNATNTVGVVVSFAMAAGSTYVAPSANTWLNGNYIAVSGQVNAAAATTDALRISGVLVLPGIYAPTAAQSPLIMRSYDQELVTCQRYFEWCVFNVQFYSHIVGGVMACSLAWAVQKRAVPTVSLPTPDPSVAGAASVGVSTAQVSYASLYGGAPQIVPNLAGQHSYVLGHRFTADARL